MTATYVVYPEDGTDTAQTSVLKAELQALLDDPSKLVAAGTATFGVDFWTLSLNQSYAQRARDFQNVATVYAQSRCTDNCYDPTINLNFQRGALAQLQFVSQEQGRSYNDELMGGSYFFDDSAGQDIPVYIVDTGANLKNTVSRITPRPYSSVDVRASQAFLADTPTYTNRNSPTATT